MNQVFDWLKNSGFRKKVVAVVLTAMAFILIPAFSYIPAFQAQAETLTSNTDSYKVDSATIKRIQDKAEDLGDSPERPIGDTGLKNIKKLGENIPETIELKARQVFLGSDTDKVDQKGIKERVDDTVKGAKSAIKDATS